ncbi:MAG TPA: hypothetical protein VEU96_30255 [Bryobacteraceae bacterium]|nr:hypothetical protein [Bryobacteraceae bacterium]
MIAKHKIRPLHREQDPDQATGAKDPVLAMLGVGRQLWELEPGDKFVERLRSEDLPVPPAMHPTSDSAGNLPEAVWRRMVKHQGEPFQTVRGLPLTFEVEGAGIWFFRDGKRVNRKLTRTQFEVALSRCPLARTTEISDLMDYPYVFAVLTDRRIRGQEW